MTELLTGTRTREDILAEIGRRAPFYAPQWRYNPEAPDAGTALAFIWADMLSGVLDRYNRVLDNYRRALLDAVGSDPFPPMTAQGYLCFQPTEGAGQVIVPSGTGAGSPDDPDAVLVTGRNLTASTAKITNIFYTDPGRDVCKRYDSLENITLFECAKSCEHIWTLAHPYAFDLSAGAVLRLKLECRGVFPGDGVRWQLDRGGGWTDFDSAEYAQDEIALRFPDEQSGKCASIRFIPNEGAGADDCRISGIYSYPSGREIIPEAIYAGDTQLPDAGLYPFGERFMPYNCFYLSCREALSKPGAAVELSFAMRMEEFAIEGYPQPEIVWKRVMKPEQVNPPEQFEASISNVAWEYYNGTGWATLPLEDQKARAVFAKGHKTLTRRTVRFICPDDMETVVCGAHDAFFIRARIMNVNNLFRTCGYYLTPWVERPRFRYSYRNGIRIETAVIGENLDTREVTLSSPAPLTSRVFEHPAVCLAFDGPFSDGALLFRMDSGIDAPELRWEYYAKTGWEALDVHDETGSLGKTGLIAYHTQIPAEKLRLMGQDAWWIRIVDAGGRYADPTRVRPLLLKIHENAAHAQARVPGEGSNLPQGRYRTLIPPVPGISSVTNPLPARGGCDGEDENRIIRRMTDAFNHGGRAVSRTDLESLAMEASLQVLRCRCFPLTDSSGKISQGDTCIVVLQKGGADGQNFTPLRERLCNYLAGRRPLAFGGHNRLHIIEPHYTFVNVTLCGAVIDMADVLTLKSQIFEKLALYLNPVSGGADSGGWEIGALPSPSELALKLRGTEGLSYIQSIDVTYTRVTENGNTIKSYADASADRFVLPENGTHEIRLHSAGLWE